MDLFIKIIFLSEDISLPTTEDFLNKLVPNLWAFLVQLFAFIVMSVIVIKFAYNPVKKFLEERRKYIQSNLDEADSKKKEATSNLEESKNSLINSRKEALEIVTNAKKEAEDQKAKILESANVEINKKNAKAKEDLEREKEKVLKEVHDEVVDIALETSKTILQRNIDVKDDQKLIDDLIDSLKEK